MGNLGKLQALGSLSLYEVLDKLLREYVALGEIVVICLKRVKRLGKRGGKSFKLCLLLLGKMEEIEVVGTQPFSWGSILFFMPSRPAISIAA